jgi:hypothetical protein
MPAAEALKIVNSYGIVLIDYRDYIVTQEGEQGVFCIDISLAVCYIVFCKQYLRNLFMKTCKVLLIRPHQA